MYTEALNLLRQATTPHGILASTVAIDNYARIWSRDSMMAGIVGLWAEDEILAQGLLNSLQTLAACQHPNGQFPSNVLPADSPKVGYGSIAGRVDATTWWLVGAGEYLLRFPNIPLAMAWLPRIEKAFSILDAWEINGRGLIYVPLGGNWADEYVVQGYVLYDQLLRLWALEKLSKVYHREDWHEQSVQLRHLLATNYRPVPNGNSQAYHQIAYDRAALEPKPYWASALAPNGYDYRWDMSSNALALLLGMGTDAERSETAEFVQQMAKTLKTWLLPAFAPTILPSDADWKLLSENYGYRFKNQPGHFHNGGSWTIFLGWLGYGFARQGFPLIASAIQREVAQALAADAFQFHEYFTEKTLKPSGTANLCFTAAGAVLLHLAL